MHEDPARARVWRQRPAGPDDGSVRDSAERDARLRGRAAEPQARPVTLADALSVTVTVTVTLTVALTTIAQDNLRDDLEADVRVAAGNTGIEYGVRGHDDEQAD